MSAAPSRQRLNVPDSLKQQLLGFQRRVWSTQMLGAAAFAITGVLIAFLAVYALDRLGDTPKSIRVAIFLGTLAAWLAIPYALYRWVWCHRRLDQLARLLRVRESIGDQLLSVIELADNDAEQARSRSLCAAAIQQVAEAASTRDLNKAAPQSRARLWTIAVAVSCVCALMLAIFSPEATRNAWARLSAPWLDTPRYTFTAIEKLDEHRVVPHGESWPMTVRLAEKSRWSPTLAKLEIPGQQPIEVKLSESRDYPFELPPQMETVTARLRIGDYAQDVVIEPKLRPELVAASAQVKLPDYLQLPEEIRRDIRGGTLSAVEGSTARVAAEASRELEDAAINAVSVPVTQASFQSDKVAIATPANAMELTWRDKDGLSGREPFEVVVQSTEDERPSVASQELPRQAVLLETEQINFNALAADDFGVKRIGISWRGLDKSVPKPAEGEKLLSPGGPDKSSLQVAAAFSAKSFGIAAQPIEVRLWAEDYLPDRPRVYSPPHIFYVLTPDEHAIWITDQLSKWHRASLDVRDREMQLHETNKKLRELTPEELADEELRNQLRTQAAAEASNGRKLTTLSKLGEQLLRQASRNPEIGVGHLERWAEMQQILNDIAANRMPSVSDLLGKASADSKLARAEPSAKKSDESKSGEGEPSEGKPGNGKPGEGKTAQSKPTGPKVGEDRNSAGGSGKPPEKIVDNGKAPLPKITDSESSLQPAEGKADEGKAQKKKYNGSKLTLPQTTLAGPAKPNGKEDKPEEPESNDDDSNMDKALYEQADLLAEFEKIADEMNTILANLEGSTLVKRLKAASREQNQVAERISDRIDDMFGQRTKTREATVILDAVAKTEQAGSQKVAFIMDDMQSYFERRRMNQFKLVLDDMRQADITNSLRQMADDVHKQQGMTIAQAEYWADSLDRWAEDLVDPACSGSCPGSKNSDALPPSVILEVLRILEGEVNLREATRVADQAKAGITPQEHAKEGTRLSETQDELGVRTATVVETIQALPEGDKRFGKEIKLLSQVARVMEQATLTLAEPQTGPEAIGIETEAIELLLQCKRINPKGGGGGGGTSPGGGGTGTTQDSALALLGTGMNKNEKREVREVQQATGETGRVLPEEFRAGLDQYFNRLEATSGQ